MSRYTFCMKLVVWLVMLAAAGGLAYWYWSWRRRWAGRKRASEERFSAFMAQAMVATPPKTAPAAGPAMSAQEKLLLDAAGKAGEANEPVLSIQLYARLLARYPQSAFASQARAAVEMQKKKLAKA
jgi:hypothetical protein